MNGMREGGYKVLLNTLVNQMKDRKSIWILFLRRKRAESVIIMTSVDVVDWGVVDTFESQSVLESMFLDIITKQLKEIILDPGVLRSNPSKLCKTVICFANGCEQTGNGNYSKRVPRHCRSTHVFVNIRDQMARKPENE